MVLFFPLSSHFLFHIGILKGYITTSHRAIAQHLHAYFGKDRPTLRVRAPHSPAFVTGDSPTDTGELEDAGVLKLTLSICGETKVFPKQATSFRFRDPAYLRGGRPRVSGRLDSDAM